jgi:hypothetical protein
MEPGLKLEPLDLSCRGFGQIIDRHHFVEPGRVVWNGTPVELRSDTALQGRDLEFWLRYCS